MSRMSERRFYCPDLARGRISLPADEAHHARNVLRVRAGELVRLFDGRGRLADATVESVGRDGVSVTVERIERVCDVDGPLPVTLAVAMPKAARQDILVEKCIELGVRAIQPVITQRSVVRPKPGRVEHWRRVSIAAAKQSGRAFLPDIGEPVGFDGLLTSVESSDLVVFGSTSLESRPLLDCLPSQTRNVDVLIVIGPEGGLTAEEEQTLTSRNALAVNLGRSVLRTETAAIAALAVVAAWLDSERTRTQPDT